MFQVEAHLRSLLLGGQIALDAVQTPLDPQGDFQFPLDFAFGAGSAAGVK